MTTPLRPYLALKADERQELRLPALLKQHLTQVAERRGLSVSEYVVQVLAANVSAELTKTLEWQVTAPEFIAFMKVMMSPASETAAMNAARAKAEALFGPAPAE